MGEDRDKLYAEWHAAATQALEVGSIWVKYPELPETHPNRQTLEIRGIVDDQVVYRFWMKGRGYFGYAIESMIVFGMDLDPERRGGAALQKSEVQDWLALGVPQEDLED